MKSKFQNLNFGSVEILSKEQKQKVKGGYSNSGSVGGTSCIASVYCTSWDFSYTQIKYASGTTCTQAYNAISCGSWSTSPGPCSCVK